MKRTLGLGGHSFSSVLHLLLNTGREFMEFHCRNRIKRDTPERNQNKHEEKVNCTVKLVLKSDTRTSTTKAQKHRRVSLPRIPIISKLHCQETQPFSSPEIAAFTVT
jgi:hypothetical protein